jgi:hypothetical protein
MKSFKQFSMERAEFFEDAQRVPAKELKDAPVPKDEIEDMEPRSKGEKDFKKLHTDKKEVIPHPVGTKGQFDSNNKQDDHLADGAKDEDGEKTPIKSGTSDVKGDEKDGSKKRDTSKAAGKDNGEKKPVMQGSSDVPKDPEIQEEIDPVMAHYLSAITRDIS